ncbi:MAG: thioredoxin-like domain-containing protein [Verrucomicrobiota bacterium]
MKKFLIPILLAPGIAFATFEKWTSNDGREAELDLVSVAEVDGEKVGTFRMRNGRAVKIPASKLIEEDAKRLDEWKSAGAAAEEPAEESVFDDILEGNLLRLSGKSLKKCEDATKPEKLYVFYYTASWCPPCQAFTPDLVKWYEENKNDNFELVLITSDRDDDAMEGYAKKAKMPWPQLKLKDAGKFKEEFEHGVKGIPSLIVCELDGTNLGNFRSRLPELAEMVK